MSYEQDFQLTKKIYDAYRVPYNIKESDGKQVFELDLDIFDERQMNLLLWATDAIQNIQIKNAGIYDQRETIGDH
jgi:hypothetical protein